MPSRRRFLRTGLAVGVTGVTGCLDELETDSTTGGSGASPAGDDTGTPTAAAGDVAWRQSLSGPVDHRPALGADRLFVGSEDGTITALSQSTGAVEWAVATDDGEQIQGSPVLTDDAVVAVAGGSGLGENHVVYALERATGDERWRFEPQEWWLEVLGTDDGSVFVATTDDALEDSGQTLYALSLADGTTRWSIEVGDNSGGLVTDETVYVPTAGALDAVDREGTRRWRVDYDRYRYKTLAVAGDTVAYVTADDPREPTVHGVDVATGDERWTYEKNGAYTTRAVDEALLVGGDAVARLDPASGESEWVADHQAALYDVPVVDGTLYTAGRTAAAIDVEDGTVAWDRSLDVYAARPIGLAGSVLVVHESAGEEDRDRHVVGIDATGGEQRWEFAGESELTRPVVGSDRAVVCEGTDVIALAV